MSKKRSTTKRRAAPVAPPGVRHIFAALSKIGDDPSKAGHDAADVLPFARRIITLSSTTGADVAFNALLADAARALWGDAVSGDREDRPERDPELMSLSGFYTGLAACWLLMTSINTGEGGAR